jgi:hypothetical protein
MHSSGVFLNFLAPPRSTVKKSLSSDGDSFRAANHPDGTRDKGTHLKFGLRRRFRVGQGFATEMCHSREARLSDAGVPGIASFRRRGAQTRAEPFHVVGDSQVSDEFYVFVAELTGEPHAKRPAVAHGKFIAIQPIG